MTQSSSPAVAAGPFSSWLLKMRRSLLGSEGMDVPCGDCVGCCVSGYSLQLRPEDYKAAARIPTTFVVNAAPGFAKGNLTVAALPDGLCPMLEDRKCTIYSDRPQTCLDYDCRIFAAAGIDAGGDDKVVINTRVRAWEFAYPELLDRQEHDAVRAAAAFIRDRRDSFSVRVPAGPMGIAVFAIKSYRVFLDSSVTSKSDAEIARAILEAARSFDSGAALS
ncbi:YkgJ family cysteine cluster protein [Steroidobacter sp.]|uniref:YkgJ family cysteine cluster protein n=1 Tax=Steroidobacter sp. TaxID=1978227 RepID=UPI001A61DC72|nr:YkgJ family cysteine cluster protein [Steroidobacter sp.]MBL8268569.1 YkgJ family cysteine cluster protein [Steroidobacter sp.]